MDNPPIEQVTIVGGTHGNEWTGIYLLEHWQQQLQLITRTEFSTKTLLANPRAYAANRRYIDSDLNRCFKHEDIENGLLANYEQSRAKAIAYEIGPWAIRPTDFVIDLHTTTSNMGLTLVLGQATEWILRLAHFVQQQCSELKIFYEPNTIEASPYLFSLGRFGGVLVEIGPTPQSLLRAEVFNTTQQVVMALLDGLQQLKQGILPSLTEPLTVFQFERKVSFPVDSNQNLTAMVHPQLQDRDFQSLTKGDPIFQTFSGDSLVFQESETLYPVFVNEAAYYDQQYAFSLMRQIKIGSA